MSLSSKGGGNLKDSGLVTWPAWAGVGGRLCIEVQLIHHVYYTMAPGRQGKKPEVQPVRCPLCVCWGKRGTFFRCHEGSAWAFSAVGRPCHSWLLDCSHSATAHCLSLSLLIYCGPQGLGIFMLRATLLISCYQWDNFSYWPTWEWVVERCSSSRGVYKWN